MVVRGIPKYLTGNVPNVIHVLVASLISKVMLCPVAKIEDFATLIHKPEISANCFITSSTPFRELAEPSINTRMSSAKQRCVSFISSHCG